MGNPEALIGMFISKNSFTGHLPFSIIVELKK